MVVEFVGGWISNSVAIMTDAAHMFSDVTAFIISILSIVAARWRSNKTSNYGYHRTEILGALTSILIIWALVVWLIVEAMERVHMIYHGKKYELEAHIMLITAFVSLACNIIGLIAVGHCCSCYGDQGILGDITSVFRPHGNHDCEAAGCKHHHHHDD